MGKVPVGCRNDQCTCLNGGTILNNACVGGGGGVKDLLVWNCVNEGVTIWVVDQTTGTASNRGALPPQSGPCAENPPDLTLSVQTGDFVSGHQYVTYAKDCDQNDPQFTSCVRSSDGPFVADRNGTMIAFTIGQ
jgi:hypothetical protein